MLYFKDEQGRAHALDDGLDPLNLAGFPAVTSITEEEFHALCAAPPLTPQQRIAEIDSALEQIDKKRTRALSDVTLALSSGGAAPQAAIEKLAALEAQAVPLRAERRMLDS